MGDKMGAAALQCCKSDGSGVEVNYRLNDKQGSRRTDDELTTRLTDDQLQSIPALNANNHSITGAHRSRPTGTSKNFEDIKAMFAAEADDVLEQHEECSICQESLAVLKTANKQQHGTKEKKGHSGKGPSRR